MSEATPTVHTPERLHEEELGHGALPHQTAGERRHAPPSLADDHEHTDLETLNAPAVPPSGAPIPDANARGWLVPVGGRMEAPAILERFVALCGGPTSRVVVVPTASDQPDTGAWYAALFARFGATQVDVLRLRRRGDRLTDEQLETVEHATGVFFSGGNQLKLATSILGTPLATLLHARFARGLHVAGTSAGAAFLSAHMIAFGEEGAAPHAGMVMTCSGLGLTDRFIIDQHFRERTRLGRLLTAIAYNPSLIGVGVDENTALFISPADEAEVVGEGSVTIVDPVGLDTTPIYEALPGTRLDLIGMQVTVLANGERHAFADMAQNDTGSRYRP